MPGNGIALAGAFQRVPGPSLPIARVFFVEHFLQLREVREGGVRVGQPAFRRLLRQVVAHDVQRLAAGASGHQDLGRALEVVEVVEGLGHRRRRAGQAVVAHGEDRPVAQRLGQARAFLGLVGDAAEAVVIAHVVEEARRSGVCDWLRSGP